MYKKSCPRLQKNIVTGPDGDGGYLSLNVGQMLDYEYKNKVFKNIEAQNH